MCIHFYHLFGTWGLKNFSSNILTTILCCFECYTNILTEVFHTVKLFLIVKKRVLHRRFAHSLKIFSLKVISDNLLTILVIKLFCIFMKIFTTNFFHRQFLVKGSKVSVKILLYLAPVHSTWIVSYFKKWCNYEHLRQCTHFKCTHVTIFSILY